MQEKAIRSKTTECVFYCLLKNLLMKVFIKSFTSNVQVAKDKTVHPIMFSRELKQTEI